MTRPIPTVDLANMSQAEAARAVDRACREDGFFYVAGHGVDTALISGIFDAMASFFAAAPDFKQRYHIRHSHPHQRGYVPVFEERLGEDHAPDFKESFDLGVDRATDHPDVVAKKPFAAANVWPDLDGFRETVEAYHAEMIRLGDDLVRLTAVGLGLDADYFDDAMSDPVANLRLLHYPPREDDNMTTGCGPHTDYGFLTVLAQDHVGGLEIEGEGGDWIYVPPVENAFVVNLGDLLTRWTAGLYRARRHRVVGNQTGERYSIPFFLDPNVDAMVETVPTCRHLPGADAPPVSAGAFLQSRFDDTFTYRENTGEPLASQGLEPYVAPQ